MSAPPLPDPAHLAAKRKPRLDNESADYAKAREALLGEEIALRRHIASLAEQRRALPPGPTIDKDYRFIEPARGEKVGLAGLFGRHDTLIAYFWMYGPDRERPCPMCTNLLGPLDTNATDVEQNVALAVVGRSSVERQKAFAVERGWRHLKFYQTCGDDFALDFGGLDPKNGWEYPVLMVLRREGDKVRLFWMGEMSGEMSDPGQDPRGAPDLAPLWNVLDLTPAGREPKWYPALEY